MYGQVIYQHGPDPSLKAAEVSFRLASGRKWRLAERRVAMVRLLAKVRHLQRVRAESAKAYRPPTLLEDNPNCPADGSPACEGKKIRRFVRRGDHFLRSGQPDRGLSATNAAKKKWRVRTPRLFSEPGFAEPDTPSCVSGLSERW